VTEQPAIDFRARPLLPEYADYLYPRLQSISSDTGADAGLPPVESIDDFVGRLDSANIESVVFAARSRVSQGDWRLTNGYVASVVEGHRDRLVPFGGIDLRSESLVSDIEEAHEHHGLRGFCVDPFQIQRPADDPALMPVYETCGRLKVPIVVTLGAMPGVDASLECGSPLALDHVAADFPELIVIGSHSGWPFTREMIATAWRRKNVYFENSFYHFAPGAGEIVDAANEWIPEKVLYASAYPFVPLEETLARFRSLGFKSGVDALVLRENARRILESTGSLR